MHLYSFIKLDRPIQIINGSGFLNAWKASAQFSPANPMILALSGSIEAQVIDIRQPDKYVIVNCFTISNSLRVFKCIYVFHC